MLRECLDKVEAVTDPRPFYDHALTTNYIIITWLLTGKCSCYSSVMWVACGQSKADNNLIHRTILQFFLVPILYPGKTSQSEHSKVQYPFSVLKGYAACFGWPWIHTYCSLHFHLGTPTSSRDGNTSVPYRSPKLIYASVFCCNIKCFHFLGFVPENQLTFQRLMHRLKNTQNSAMGFKVLCIFSYFVSNKPEMLNKVFSFSIIKIDPRD